VAAAYTPVRAIALQGPQWMVLGDLVNCHVQQGSVRGERNPFNERNLQALSACCRDHAMYGTEKRDTIWNTGLLFSILATTDMRELQSNSLHWIYAARD
jgi:hypothetical protein